jgi:predicted MPP superfamily phosphohydrolase
MDFLFRLLFFVGVTALFVGSQVYWFRRGAELGRKFIPSKLLRWVVGSVGVGLVLSLLAFNLAYARYWPTPTQLTLRSAILEAPFQWWTVSSVLGFMLAILFWTAARIVRAARWIYRRLSVRPASASQGLGSPERRRFLEQTALAVTAAPFVACGYAMLYGRLNLETARQRIKLARLPKAFEGFRIAQISDVHIGPFMPEAEIRKYVAIANELRPDLIVLTGDFVTWDPRTQEEVVLALSGLKAPMGVFGCLGNHEIWSRTEDSITRLFAQKGIRILRQERAPIQAGGETLNLVGVDYQSTRGSRGRWGGTVPRYLPGMEELVMPDTANILLTHNPNAFDRAHEIGFDLSLAGHTHGGQVTLEFIHPRLSPSRLITDYVRGHFQKGMGQLYVNRGIGTIGPPMRFGSPPEITVFELLRQT